MLEDALSANGPHIQTFIDYGMDFIFNIKPVENALLFEEMHERFRLGKVTLDMSWITSLEITQDNIYEIVRCASQCNTHQNQANLTVRTLDN